jgi:uncharacterized membrane protein YebE (DUF533 family)
MACEQIISIARSDPVRLTGVEVNSVPQNVPANSQELAKNLLGVLVSAKADGHPNEHRRPSIERFRRLSARRRLLFSLWG